MKYTSMKFTPCFLALFLFLVGCSQQDPIDSIVEKASSNPIFPSSNIIVELIKLPATAPIAEVVSKALEPRGPEGKNVTILETRQVQIANADKNRVVPSDFLRYTAVLVNTSSGRKVILLQFQPDGWWNQIYDLPPSA
jgi:hypothetical protein